MRHSESTFDRRVLVSRGCVNWCVLGTLGWCVLCTPVLLTFGFRVPFSSRLVKSSLDFSKLSYQLSTILTVVLDKTVLFL
jgi:hypothetical protein